MVGWAADRAAIDRALRTVTERHARALGPVAAPIQYALGSSGKRVRGLALCIAAYRACGGTRDAGPIGAAIEIVHAYSLVHDDLPCMDDDVMRRGRPTVHVEYGVKSATVAGVTMVALAVRAMIDACATAGVDSPTRSRIIGRIMSASGAGGMVGGQLLDLLGESRSLSIEELENDSSRQDRRADRRRGGDRRPGRGGAGPPAVRLESLRRVARTRVSDHG